MNLDRRRFLKVLSGATAAGVALPHLDWEYAIREALRPERTYFAGGWWRQPGILVNFTHHARRRLDEPMSAAMKLLPTKSVRTQLVKFGTRSWVSESRKLDAGSLWMPLPDDVDPRLFRGARLFLSGGIREIPATDGLATLEVDSYQHVDNAAFLTGEVADHPKDEWNADHDYAWVMPTVHERKGEVSALQWDDPVFGNRLRFRARVPHA